MPNSGGAFNLQTLLASGATSVAFSPDQTRIFIAKEDGTLDVFDVATRQKIATLTVGTSLGALSVSPDGSFVFVVERYIPPFESGVPRLEGGTARRVELDLMPTPARGKHSSFFQWQPRNRCPMGLESMGNITACRP